MNMIEVDALRSDFLAAGSSLSREDRDVLQSMCVRFKWSLVELMRAFIYAAAEGVDTLLDPVLAGVPVSDVLA